MRILEGRAQCLYEHQLNKTDNPEYLAGVKDLLDKWHKNDTSSYMVYRTRDIILIELHMSTLNINIGTLQLYDSVVSSSPSNVGARGRACQGKHQEPYRLGLFQETVKAFFVFRRHY